jgi:hypothetical protein
MLRDEWSWLETQRASERERPGGVPLGLFAWPDVGPLRRAPHPKHWNYCGREVIAFFKLIVPQY